MMLNTIHTPMSAMKTPPAISSIVLLSIVDRVPQRHAWGAHLAENAKRQISRFLEYGVSGGVGGEGGGGGGVGVGGGGVGGGGGGGGIGGGVGGGGAGVAGGGGGGGVGGGVG